MLRAFSHGVSTRKPDGTVSRKGFRRCVVEWFITIKMARVQNEFMGDCLRRPICMADDHATKKVPIWRVIARS